MNRHIVVVGSLNADFVTRTERFPMPGETITGLEFAMFPGGKGANQAFAAARLGAQVSMIGQVGVDTVADQLKQNLAKEGVDVTHVAQDPSVSSGIASITIDRHGQNQIIIVSGANGTFSPERLAHSQNLIASASLVLLQLEIPLGTVQAAAQIAKDAGATVILDPAPARPLSAELLGLVDYLTPNETELSILAGTDSGPIQVADAALLAGKLRSQGAKKVIAKLGARGALLVTEEGEHFWPALPVVAVDATAAGDAFNAGFAAALARGCSELEAGRFASATAACSVTRPGAQPSMPTLKEVEMLLCRG